MKRSFKLLSLLLVLCLIIPTLVGFTSFEEATETEIKEEAIQTITPEIIETSELPDIISEDEAISNGYVGRLKSQEKDLHTFVFKNSDGTNTMQVYSHPVKYIDKLGNVQDISLEVKANSDGSFSSASHSVITTFEKKLSDGISLSHEDVNIKITPTGLGIASPSAKVSTDNKSVAYALNSKTAYVYELTYSGFKEDIVVNEYTGQTEYTFTLHTNGLTLTEEDGSYYLTDDEGNIRATIGDIIIFTADERNNTFGSMTHETVRANSEYTMTIHIDADYLSDENTLYPIRIDPTVEIVSAGTSGFIEDATMNSNSGSGGSSGSILVGVRGSYGVSRIIMRFPNLSLEGISASDITAATIGLRDIMCQSNENFVVECRVYDKSAPAWSESSPPTFTAASPYVGSTVLDSYTVTYDGGDNGGNWYHFNIIEAAKAWANGTQDPAKGLVFKASDSFENQTTNLWYKTFGSYNRSSYKPSLKIVYNAGVSVTPDSVSILKGNTYSLQITTNATSVSWTSSNPYVATVNENGIVTGVNAGTATITATITGTDNTQATATCTVYVHLPNGVYNFLNMYSNMALFVKDLSILDGTNAVQTVYTPNSNETRVIRQLWKITYLGSGRYSIRPLHKLDMALNYNDGNAEIKYINSTDTTTSVPDTAEWTIEVCTSGYYGYWIKNVGQSNKTLQLVDANMEIDGNVIASTLTEDDICLWDVYQATDIPTGVLLYDRGTGERVTNPTIIFEPNSTKTLTGMNLSVATYPVYGQTLSWVSSHTDKATVNASSGKVTAVHYGNSIITGTFSDGETVTFTVDIMSIPEGTYFLRNKQVGYYADIEGPTMANGTEIHQWTFNGNNSQKWIFDYLGSGYYTLKSANSTTAYYLGVENDANTKNANIVLRSGTITAGMKWRVTVTDSGAYRLTPQTGDWCLATNTSDQTTGVKLIQGEYMPNNGSYRDEWDIHHLKYNYSVYHYFDEGYAVRFSELDSNTENLINSYQRAVYERLMKIFEIQITSQYYSYTSSGDTCKKQLYGSVSLSSIGKNCTHSSCHLTTSVLRDDLNNGTDTATVVIWTGHLMNDNYGDRSNSNSYRHSVVITPWLTSTYIDTNTFEEDVYRENVFTLIHELSHQIGAPDHYCYGIKNGDSVCSNNYCDECRNGYSEPRSCLMSYRYDISTLTDEEMYCNDCITAINAHLANHH